MHRRLAGRMAYLAGEAAEHCVAREYERRGYRVARRRWRGPGGEIDLIIRSRDALVFVEVKKGRDFACAAQRVGRRQMDRICVSAEGFMADEPDGPRGDVRFDAALVDGAGAVQIVENAFGPA